MAIPGVSHQAKVVAHQLFTGAEGTAADGFWRMGGSTWVLLPALDAAGELHHGALAQRAMGRAGVQPAVNGGGNGGMTGRHGRWRNWREHSPCFHGCAARSIWVIAMAVVRHPVLQLLHPLHHCLVLLLAIRAAARASVTAAPGASGVMHLVQHIYISERF